MSKELDWEKIKERKVLISILCVLGCIVLGVSIIQGIQKVQNNHSDDILRLHVRANSDLKEDQEMKYHVRDWIINYLQPAKDQINSQEQFIDFLNINKNTIEKDLHQYLKKRNVNKEAYVNIKTKEFPTRRYRGEVIPGGEYEALEVVIGEGNGSNWWCVLFPPLCYVDLTVAGDSQKDDTKQEKPEVKFVVVDWLFDLLS
ncbi:stage II sporulation protein R [Natranaerobius trueperi]|nr:stage II sporulation protein R [Natranaerobius trueperi]